jgi:alkylation response protein AidB-like acyl-CoA dehydrogenase
LKTGKEQPPKFEQVKRPALSCTAELGANVIGIEGGKGDEILLAGEKFVFHHGQYAEYTVLSDATAVGGRIEKMMISPAIAERVEAGVRINFLPPEPTS